MLKYWQFDTGYLPFSLDSVEKMFAGPALGRE